MTNAIFSLRISSTSMKHGASLAASYLPVRAAGDGCCQNQGLQQQDGTAGGTGDLGNWHRHREAGPRRDTRVKKVQSHLESLVKAYVEAGNGSFIVEGKLFHLLKTRFNDPMHRKSFQGINLNELLFADDTLVIARSARLANHYLHLIESESKYLHLKLKRNKCSYLAFNGHGTLRFANGQPMTCSEVLYLGVKVTKKMDPKHEIRSGISATMAILKRLDLFWLKTKCCKKWKLLVYDR